MPRVLRASAMGLTDLLASHETFYVPEFQRVYGWGEVEIKRLLGDLTTTLNAPAQRLFLGTIYLAAPAEDAAAQVADGQQRLLTASILYAVARDLSPSQEAERLHRLVMLPSTGQPRFRPREGDADFLRQWVQEPGATLRPFMVADARGDGTQNDDPEAELSESQRNIIVNRDMLTERLKPLGPEGLRALVTSLEERTDLVVITAPTIEEARNAYASTQTRGLRQAETDKLKAELIGDCPAPLRARLAGQWEECEAMLGKEDLAELLQWMIVIAGERKPQHAIEVDLFKTFGLPQAVEQFISAELVQFASACKALCGPDLGSSRTGRRIAGHLVTLLRTTHDSWKAPALLALRRYENDPPVLEAILRDLERLAASLMIRGTDPNLMMERYLAVIRALKAPGAGLGPLDLSTKEKAETRTALADSRFAMRDRFRMPLLLKINDLLAGGVQSVDAKTVSCEHILPRNAPSGSPWRTVFGGGSGGRYQGGRFVHMLGNLTVLPHDENRRADTHPFAQKRLIFKRSTLAISKEAATWKDWTPEVIQARTQRLSKLLVDHWRFI